MEQIFRNFVLLSTVADSSSSADLSVNYMMNITRTYMAGESVLFVPWINSSDLSGHFIKYLASSEIVTMELCNVERVSNVKKLKRSHVENIFILLDDVVLDEKQIRMLQNCKSWNSESKIVISGQNVDKETVHIFLQKFWTLTKVLNVTVMSAMPTSMKFYTIQPYKHFILEEPTIENLFPNKIPKNFNESILSAFTIKYAPFVIFNSDQIPHEGIEIRIMNEISKHLNFRIEYKNIPAGESPWFSRRINGRLTGSLGLLERYEIDVMFYGFPLRIDRYEFGDVIAIHTIDKIVWIVPTFPYMFDWASLFVVFRKDMWILIFVFLILNSIVVYFLTKPGYQSFSFVSALMQVLGLLLAECMTYRHHGHLYRFFMIILSFYTVNIVAFYESSLITFLTSPRSGKEYETLEEAVDDGLIAGLYPGGDIYDMKDPFWRKVLTPGKHVYSMEYGLLLETIHKNKTMFGYGGEIGLKHRSNEYFEKKGEVLSFKKMEDRSDIYFASIMAPKGHALLRLLRFYIMRLVESGLVEFWAEELVRSKRDDKSRDPFPLSLMHLHGLFFICLGILALSFIVFIFEIVYGNGKFMLGKLCSSCLKCSPWKRKSL